MSSADLVTLWAWVGVGLVAAFAGAWARYFIIRYSAEEEVARLRVPVAVTVALVVVVMVLVVVAPATTT